MLTEEWMDELNAAQREEEESERGPLKTNWDQIDFFFFFFAFGSGGVGASELKSTLRFPPTKKSN